MAKYGHIHKKNHQLKNGGLFFFTVFFYRFDETVFCWSQVVVFEIYKIQTNFDMRVDVYNFIGGIIHINRISFEE